MMQPCDLCQTPTNFPWLDKIVVHGQLRYACPTCMEQTGSVAMEQCDTCGALAPRVEGTAGTVPVSPEESVEVLWICGVCQPATPKTPALTVSDEDAQYEEEEEYNGPMPEEDPWERTPTFLQNLFLSPLFKLKIVQWGWTAAMKHYGLMSA